MSVEKVYKCDLCGEFRLRATLVRFGARTLDDRPEDADNIDVCTGCYGRPVNDVMDAWRRMQKEAEGGD